jgi:hypothetical protein
MDKRLRHRRDTKTMVSCLEQTDLSLRPAIRFVSLVPLIVLCRSHLQNKLPFSYSSKPVFVLKPELCYRKRPSWSSGIDRRSSPPGGNEARSTGKDSAAGTYRSYCMVLQYVPVPGTGSPTGTYGTGGTYHTLGYGTSKYAC